MSAQIHARTNTHVKMDAYMYMIYGTRKWTKLMVKNMYCSSEWVDE